MDRDITCCFAGHDNCNGITKNDIVNVVEELIVKHRVNTFLVGNYGSFDRISAGAVLELKKTYSNIKLELVIPYITVSILREKEYYSEYDSIVVADMPLNTPRNLRIIKANEYMVKKSQFLICYIDHSWGGAAKTVEFAKKKGIKIINIAKRD